MSPRHGRGTAKPKASRRLTCMPRTSMCTGPDIRSSRNGSRSRHSTIRKTVMDSGVVGIGDLAVRSTGDDYDLGHHGDSEVGEGLIDLAVNVRMSAPPDWLLHQLRESLSTLAAYPDTAAAVVAIAARHHREPDVVVPTAGGA